jgi:hypothetical protein
MVSNLALFCLGTVLATFQKIGEFFSKSSGHPSQLSKQIPNQSNRRSMEKPTLSVQLKILIRNVQKMDRICNKLVLFVMTSYIH